MTYLQYSPHKIFLAAALLVVSFSGVSASEISGTLSTGLGNSSVSATVISSPVASPVAGTYSSTQMVTLSAAGSMSIRYTTDGVTTPTCTTGAVYSSAIFVGTNQTIQAIACYPNAGTSTVSSHAYVMTAGGGGGSSGGGGGGGGGSVITPVVTTPVVSTPTVVTPTQQTQAPAVVGQVLGATTFSFPKNLAVGSRSADVTELQKVLIQQGFLKASATGYFGSLTRTALIAWQKKNKLPATGYFGPLSRALIAPKTN